MSKTYRIIYTGYLEAKDLWEAVENCENIEGLELTEVTELVDEEYEE